MLTHMIFTLFTFKNDQNEEMRKLMPTCSNIIHPIIHFRFPVTWERNPWRVQKTAFQSV